MDFQSHLYSLYAKEGFVVMKRIRNIYTSQIVYNTVLLQFWKEIDHNVNRILKGLD